MQSLTGLRRRARVLDAELDVQREQSRRRYSRLRLGIHERLASPTMLGLSFAAGIVAGQFHRHVEDEDTRKASERKVSTLRTASGYASWALRVYLTQKAALFLRSIA